MRMLSLLVKVKKLNQKEKLLKAFHVLTLTYGDKMWVITIPDPEELGERL